MVIKIEVFPCNPWALLETYRGGVFQLDRGYSWTACVVRLDTGEAKFKLRSYDCLHCMSSKRDMQPTLAESKDSCDLQNRQTLCSEIYVYASRML
jgi:hypothetical protein